MNRHHWVSVHPIPFPDSGNECDPSELTVGDRNTDLEIIPVKIPLDELSFI